MPSGLVASLHFYSLPLQAIRRDWKVILIASVSYFAIHSFSSFFTSDIGLNPAIAILLCALFFCGLRLFPIVYATALLAEIAVGAPPLLIAIVPIAVTVQSILGAHLMRRFKIDPIFRSDRDVLRLLAVVAFISAIFPAFLMLAYAVIGNVNTWNVLLHTYVATSFSFLIGTPFIMRWYAKPRFHRTWPEIVEIFAVFTILIFFDFVFFVRDTQALLGVSLRYILLIPFFAIALRLRPRFVTLALAITASFASFGSSSFALEARPELTYESQLYLIALGISFLIITSLEEHRRVMANQLSSKVAVLQNAVVRISSESQAKNDFIAILAHELRNPLTPVVSGIDLLRLRLGSDEDLNKTLDMMTEGMKTVRSLLDDLLDVSRISEGKISLNKEKVDIGSILERAARSTEHHRKERHQSLFLKSSADVFVFGDPLRLEQIFSNLLTNASKYSDSGDTIIIAVRKQGTFAEVEVLDEGMGIEQHALESIFEPFHQVKDERSKDGLGIGLSLVRDLVKMHDGSVQAESKGRGHGSRFIVRLPLALEKR